MNFRTRIGSMTSLQWVFTPVQVAATFESWKDNLTQNWAVGNKLDSEVKEEVTAFVVPEMSNAVMRMSALGAAMVLQEKRMETVMQVCCRDRNRIALQADILAASACGITNIMAVTGEDPSFGDHHQAKAVYDISIDELLKTIKGL